MLAVVSKNVKAFEPKARVRAPNHYIRIGTTIMPFDCDPSPAREDSDRASKDRPGTAAEYVAIEVDDGSVAAVDSVMTIEASRYGNMVSVRHDQHSTTAREVGSWGGVIDRGQGRPPKKSRASASLLIRD